ncbi:unnamed protein product [Clonostachys solani]|uniref:Saccharopine dehydrogenase NADP binding domain-containing protein n=1 Tax=Clonostachys solani TaxID=160281 RepID=A0A9P0EAG3_9HYPO|nr:unnamed protein product [Clonostachys solani]
MARSAESRKYDLVVLGATGYTGKLTAQSVAKNFPGDLKWAIAGRSKTKLQELAAELRGIRPDGSHPEIEIVDLEQTDQVDAVVQQTKVCISIVTYWRVGEIVVEACVKHKTDYVDAAGEPSHLKGWIEKYHEKAESEGTALIHASSMYSGPQDLLSWAAARELKRAFGADTKEVILTNTKLDPNPSGGTFEGMMVGTSKKQESKGPVAPPNPWIVSPIPGTAVHPQATGLLIREDPDLGLLSEYSMARLQNQAIVYRTWGLLQVANEGLGPNFQYNEYDSVGSKVEGFFKMLEFRIITTLLSNILTLRLLKLFMPAPGSGPDVRKTATHPIEMQALAIADGNDAQRATASFSFPSGSYHTTALFLSQAAASLLYSKSLEGGIKGGCLTPAILGEDFVQRIRAAGAVIEISSKQK